MSTSRNAPCPCGSGLKYKHCCLRKDLEKHTASMGIDIDAVEDHVAKIARDSEYWELDALPVPIGFEDDEHARPVMIMVVADGFVLHSDMISNASAEPADVARLLSGALDSGATAAGRLPPEVRVRHQSVAQALAPELAPRAVRVTAAPHLPGVEDARRQIWEDLDLPPMARAIAIPETWTAWGLPRKAVADLFKAAAEYYRSAPWTSVYDFQSLHALMPDGRSWWLSVMGAGEVEFGLAMYANELDLTANLETADPAAAVAGFVDDVLSITFDSRQDLSKPMLRDIARGRWEIAGPRAYPLLIAFNTPTGGVCRRHASDITGLLRSVPGFVNRFQSLLTGEERWAGVLSWTDPNTGIEVSHDQLFMTDYDPFGLEHPWESLWETPTKLTTALPEGPRADPTARLDPKDLEASMAELSVIQGFVAWLSTTGVSQATTEKHVKNATTFVTCLATVLGLPLVALSEHDLRLILYDIYPQMSVIGHTQAMAMRTSMRRFFEYATAAEAIELPWADPVLSEKNAFEERWESCPRDGQPQDVIDEWRAELWVDLDERVMVPEQIADDAAPATVGRIESQLTSKLHRLWLIWRDEVIRSGVSDPDTVRSELIVRQQAWETEPQSALDGKPPIEIVQAEREAAET